MRQPCARLTAIPRCNGSGKPDGVFAQPKTGLGTGVVKALARQLDAQVVTSSGALGTKVSVTHATFAAA
jgi:chemotaxis protein methyltransferase CheR